MADKKISQLPQGNLTESTIFPIVTSNITSKTTYANIIDSLKEFFITGSTDTFVSGMTFNNSNYNLTLTRNDGVTLTQNLGILASDMTITGGTYNSANGVATFTNNSGGTFSVSGFSAGITDTYITGGTYSAGTAVFTNNSGGTFSVSGFNETPAYIFRVGVGGGDHYHLAYMSLEQANYLVESSFNEVLLVSNEEEGHSHTITVIYDSIDNMFIVTNITSGGDVVHQASLLGVENDINKFLQEPVSNFIDFTTNEPADPFYSLSYISTTDGVGSISNMFFYSDSIYRWNGHAFIETLPKIGMSLYVSELASDYKYTNSGWVLVPKIYKDLPNDFYIATLIESSSLLYESNNEFKYIDLQPFCGFPIINTNEIVRNGNDIFIAGNFTSNNSGQAFVCSLIGCYLDLNGDLKFNESDFKVTNVAVHGLLFHNEFLFLSSRASQTTILKINPYDLSDVRTLVLPNDSTYGGRTTDILAYKDKLYVLVTTAYYSTSKFIEISDNLTDYRVVFTIPNSNTYRTGIASPFLIYNNEIYVPFLVSVNEISVRVYNLQGNILRERTNIFINNNNTSGTLATPHWMGIFNNKLFITCTYSRTLIRLDCFTLQTEESIPLSMVVTDDNTIDSKGFIYLNGEKSNNDISALPQLLKIKYNDFTDVVVLLDTNDFNNGNGSYASISNNLFKDSLLKSVAYEIGVGNIVIGKVPTTPVGVNNVTISDGSGTVMLVKDSTNNITAPNLTTGLINTEVTGKSLITKEYLETPSGNTFVVSGSYSSGTATFVNNLGDSFAVSGFSSGSSTFSPNYVRGFEGEGESGNSVNIGKGKGKIRLTNGSNEFIGVDGADFFEMSIGSISSSNKFTVILEDGFFISRKYITVNEISGQTIGSFGTVADDNQSFFGATTWEGPTGDYEYYPYFIPQANSPYSFSTGNQTQANGNNSYAEGFYTQANGQYSHAEGNGTIATGDSSHAEGYYTIGYGIYSHAEGIYTIASGQASHAEGYSSVAEGDYSHAEGSGTRTLGFASHAEGQSTIASGFTSHAGGNSTVANGQTSFVFGDYSTVNGNYSIVLGSNIIGNADNTTYVDNLNVRTLGSGTSVYSLGIDADGFVVSGASGSSEVLYWSGGTGFGSINSIFCGATATGDYSLAIGTNTEAIGYSSVSEGSGTQAIGFASHAEGVGSIASGDSSHAEGSNTRAFGNSSHSEGLNTIASGDYSHAEGFNTKAFGVYSHAEGQSSSGSGQISHAEGYSTMASGDYSHAEGAFTTASGFYSHAEGYETIANGIYSHAGGETTIANGIASFVHGSGSTVNGNYSIVLGRNITGDTADTTYVDNLNIKTLGSNFSNTSLGIDFNGNIVSGATSGGGYSSQYTGTTNVLGAINGVPINGEVTKHGTIVSFKTSFTLQAITAGVNTVVSFSVPFRIAGQQFMGQIVGTTQPYSSGFIEGNEFVAVAQFIPSDTTSTTYIAMMTYQTN